MSLRAIIAIVVIVILIIAAPVFIATTGERFFEGVGIIFSTWTDGK